MKFDSIIIGAGISGLVAAHRLKKSGRDVLLIESSPRVGGVIHSHQAGGSLEAGGFLIETGPNSFRGSHDLIDLIEELNLSGELVTADPRAPAYVYSGGELHAVPMSPSALIKTKLISTPAKLRLLKEPFVKTGSVGDEESIASFVRRRLGNEVLEKLVAPFLSGVYAGDPERLSVRACFPKLTEFEAEAGSILLGALKAARRKQEKPKRSLRPYRLCSFRNGLNTLPLRLAQELGESLLTEALVTTIRQTPSGFDLMVEHQGESRQFSSSSLIMATPAFTAAELLKTAAPEVAGLLAEIPYVSLASVPLAYRVEQIKKPLDGFGFLIPRGKQLRTLGSIWNSFLFTGRAPAGWALTNNFIGGATDPQAIKLRDDELVQTVHRDLSKVLGMTGEPKPLPITRYQRAIPQYELGHAARVAKIEKVLPNYPGLRLAGNYLHGVSLGDCVKQAELLAVELEKSK